LLIYDKIKAICEEKSLSIRQVEVAAGLKNGAISKWNDSSPTVKSLKAVADVLKVKVDKLIS
jgi:transcriptional regulator with XRE-family HTH domain